MTDIVKRTTVNYNLRIPVFDAPGWGREMERNFDILDATIFAATGLGSILGLWTNATVYVVGDRVADSDGRLWVNNINHTSPTDGSFADARTANPTYWTQITETTAFRGDWASGVTYNINDFIVDTYRYGIAMNKFTSTDSYDADVAAGNITTLIDLVPYYNLMTQYVDAAALSEQNAATSEDNSAASAVVAAQKASDANDSAVLAESYKNTALATYADLAGGSPGQVLLKQTATDFDFHWSDLTGGGDMLRATYDPSNVGASAFLMDNMTEGADTKIMTSSERAKLAGVETAADVTDAGNVSPVITNLAVKGSIADGDYLVTTDSAAGNVPKRNLFSVVKTALKAYFDTLYVPVARTISASTGLSGGGALSADRSLAVVYGATAGTAAQGNDARITGAAQKTDLASQAAGKGASTVGIIPITGITAGGVQTALEQLAQNTVPGAVMEWQSPIASPANVANSAWATMPLTTLMRNSRASVSLSSSRFVPAVNGWVEWEHPAWRCNTIRSRLFNVTDGVEVSYSTLGQSQTDTGGDMSFCRGGGPVIAGKTYQIDIYKGGGTITNSTSIGSYVVAGRVTYWRGQ